MTIAINQTSQINTNNGWGFGGYIATKTVYANGCVSLIGKNCYRHTGTSSFQRYYDEHENAISKELFLQKIQAN